LENPLAAPAGSFLLRHWIVKTFAARSSESYDFDMSAIRIQDLERDVAGSLRRVEAGETLVITRDEQPVAEIKPIEAKAKGERPFGLAKGKFDVPDDFNAPLPDDMLDGFEGR